MISAQTRRVCREGKPLHTFPDHALKAADMAQVSAPTAHKSDAPRDVFDRLAFVGWSGGLAAIVIGLTVSFLLFGYFVTYWRNADMDFMVIYSAIAMNAGK